VPLLYIDDDPDDRALLELAVRRTDNAFTLYTADGAQAAAPHFDLQPKTKHDPFPRPKLILLDYDMGVHTGADFLIWLRVVRRFTFIPVIMYSGSVGARHIAECYEAGANYFLCKPARFETIKEIITVLHLCLRSDPPSFRPLLSLSEYAPDPRKHYSEAVPA
jgi:CheY-like chemotaxis protein